MSLMRSQPLLPISSLGSLIITKPGWGVCSSMHGRGRSSERRDVRLPYFYLHRLRRSISTYRIGTLLGSFLELPLIEYSMFCSSSSRPWANILQVRGGGGGGKRINNIPDTKTKKNMPDESNGVTP
jgi:hypothetical protein